MKTKILLIALTLTLTSLTMACPSENRAEMRQQRIAEKLNLTADQQIKFEEIMQAKHESLIAAKEQVNADSKAQLEQILSAEQMQMLEEKRNRHHKKMRRR